MHNSFRSIAVKKKLTRKKEVKYIQASIPVYNQENINASNIPHQEERNIIKIIPSPTNESISIDFKEDELIHKPTHNNPLPSEDSNKEAKEINKIEIQNIKESYKDAKELHDKDKDNISKEANMNEKEEIRIKEPHSRRYTVINGKRHSVNERINSIKVRIPAKFGSAKDLRVDNIKIEVGRNSLEESVESTKKDIVLANTYINKSEEVIKINDNSQEQSSRLPPNSLDEPIVSETNNSRIEKSSFEDVSISKNTVKTFDHKSIPGMSILYSMTLMQFEQSEESQSVRDSYSLPSLLSNTSKHSANSNDFIYKNNSIVKEQSASNIQVDIRFN